MPQGKRLYAETNASAKGRGPLRGLMSALAAPFHLLIITLLLLLIDAFAQEHEKNLAEMSLEDLMNIEVTSAAKREQPLAETAAAVYVITQEDIRRSGATSIPDALRLAPGVQVAQINAHVWAVSIRGFNYRYANKLLVLIDGRAVYTAVFSGVVWMVEDTLLEDIERIEVIRGPGATLWGANAVNGVINIITKNARDTEGGLLTATGSSRSGYGAARFGGKTGESFAYRVFGKYSGWIPRSHLPPMQTDGWDAGRVGFRADWKATASDSVTFSGDGFRGSADEAYIIPILVSPFNLDSNSRLSNGGGNLLARWSHRFGDDSEAALQVYYDHIEYQLPVASFQLNVADLDFEYQRQLGRRQQWIWGWGYRATPVDVHGTPAMQFNPGEQPWWLPNRKTRNLFSGFFQDEIGILPNQLSVIVGSKFESNEYTGFEYQPSARLLWKPDRRQALWVSMSRAVRTPSDFEEESRIESAVIPSATGLPAVVTMFGQRGLRSEQLLAYEAGYRAQASRRVSLDIAGFYNLYHDLVAEAAGQPYPEVAPAPPHLIVPVRWNNSQHAHGYGLELSGNYVPVSFWKLTGSYSWLRIKVEPENIITTSPAGNNPEHSFQIRSSLSLPSRLELDNNFFYTGRLAAQPLPAYLRMDARLAWLAGERLQFSVHGQNLLRPLHREFAFPADVQGFSEISRAVYGKVTWQF